MQSKKLDLIEISRIIYAKRWFILIFALIAATIGLIFSFVATKQYSSTSIFIVKSPMNMDRNHVYRQGHYERNDFFADADDIDKVLAIGKNEILLQFLVDSFDLAEHYKVANPQKAYKILKRKFKIKRHDNLSLQFRATDFDPHMAAAMTNAARWKTGEIFRDYFLQTNRNYVEGLKKSISEIDAEIEQTDESISSLRQQYQINAALLPVRGEALQTTPAAVDAEKAKGMELLQKATSIKDQLLEDRATYVSLINEYKLNVPDDGMDMFFTIQHAWPSDEATFPKIPLILAICFVAGLGFSVIIVLLKAGIQYIHQEN